MADIERDDFIESLASELRRPVRFDAEFDARVMTAIESPVIALRPERPSRPWLLRPRLVAVSPLSGFALAAALGGIMVFGAMRSGETPTQVALNPVDAPVGGPFIQVSNAPEPEAVPATPFIYVNKSATSVAIVGDFNDWDATKTPLARIAGNDSTWVATVGLPAGRYEYQIVIDGEKWVNDPSAQQRVPSEFGGENSVVTVGRGIR